MPTFSRDRILIPGPPGEGVSGVELAALQGGVARVDPGAPGTVGDVLTVGPSGPAWMRGDRVSLLHPRFGVAGDGVTDDTAAIQAAIDSGLPLWMPNADYRVTATLHTDEDTNIVGAGKGANLVADGIAGPVILTYIGSGENHGDSQYLGNFNISGTATCAIAFAHFQNSTAERITLEGFTGPDGYVFEYTWGARFVQLATNGATISRANFKVNKVVLASLWDNCYTSNFTDFNLYIDSKVTEYSTGAGLGEGIIAFQNFTAQGGDVAGVCIANGGGGTTSFYDLYTENNNVDLIVGRDADLTFSVDFYNCNFISERAGSPFGMFLHNIGGINFFGGRVEMSAPLIFGHTAGAVNFHGTHRTGGNSIWDLVRRSSKTLGNMLLTVMPLNSVNNSAFILKHTDYGYGFQTMTVNSAGAWTATPSTPALVDWKPAVLTASGTTVTATVTAHGYTTGNTVQVAGASPKAYNGTYTITVTGANTFTYTAGSAPGASPAIGAPVVLKP